MDAIDRKYLLAKKGLQIKDIAREYGCSRVAVSNTIHGKVHSPGLQFFIAQKLGIPRERLFPETNLRNYSLEDQTVKAVLV